MDIYKEFLAAGEPLAAGLYENTERGLFYRKALGLRRYCESAPLPDYDGGRLYPSGACRYKTAVRPTYQNGFAVDPWLEGKVAPEHIKRLKGEFFGIPSFVPAEHTVGGNMYTHSMPNYKRIAADGLDSYVPRIEKIEDNDIREGLLHLVEGLRTYCGRIVTYLTEQNAYPELIKALGKVPFKPAESIYEALVCHNFLYYLDSCDNVGCLASDLMPYYKGEDISDLLREFFVNVDATGGYSMSLGVDYNPLTVQCLNAAKGLRRPMAELLVNQNTPDEVWDAALDTVRTNGGQPAFYNYNKLIKGLGKRFPEIRPEDLDRFCGGGCTETMLEGLCNVGSLDAGIHLLLIFRRVIVEQLTDCGSLEELYGRFMKEVVRTVDEVTDGITRSQELRSRRNPLPMRTLLVDDCIDNGTDFNNGGARYMWSIVSFAGIANVADSLIVIEDLVYKSKSVTPEELIEKLESNDKGFILGLRKHPCRHGIDDSRANAMVRRVTADVYSALEGRKPHFGLGFLPASIMFNTAANAGKKIGATPDGRLSGEPIAESLGAILSKDTEGATALLSSVASMELGKALGVPVVNLTVNAAFDNAVLKSLIKSYMDMGGIHLQITCTSKQMLEEAYADPSRHPNLVIRVGGYSEYFRNLGDELKRLVMSRMIH